ncbi:MAG: MMPL family transporter [Deltaproteobacteria bacterium]|nr:MMPL family transporter [Deltaproteobacteria bacterium]
MIERMLKTWLSWVMRWPRTAITLCVALAAVSIWLTVERLGIKTDQLSLIKKNHPLIALTERLEPFNFDGESAFVVVVQAPSPPRAVAFAKALEKRILETPETFQKVFYRIDPERFKKWALLYLDKEDILKIRETLQGNAALIQAFVADPDLTAFLQLMNREMASRMIGELFTGFLDQEAAENGGETNDRPMDLGVLIETLEGLSSHLKGSREYRSPWSSFFQGSSVDPELKGYFWEADRELLIMSVIPVKKKNGFAFESNCLECLRKKIQESQAEFPDVRVGVTGQEALNTDEMLTVSADMARATWASLLGVLVLMFMFLRSFRRPLMEFFSLGVGLCWTFGWTTLFIGHVNILSIVFAPLLCGLGVDYGIYWFSRMEEEEKKNGVSVATVVRRVMERSGPGIFIAGLGTSLSLLPFVLTGFRGLMELGLITGTGILLTLAADLTLLPAFSVLFLPPRSPKRAALREVAERDVLRLSPKSAACVLVLTALLCVLSYIKGREVKFDLNPLRLQAPNAEAVIWERLLLEKSRRSPLSASVFASSPEEVREKSTRIEALPSVSEVESLFSLLPEDQEEKVPLLQSLLPLLPVVDDVAGHVAGIDETALKEILERIRFKLQDEEAERWGAARPLIEQISRARGLIEEVIMLLATSNGALEGLERYSGEFRRDLLTTWRFLREGASVSPMLPEDIPEEVRGRYFKDGVYLLRIYPKESIWEEGTLNSFVRDLQTVDPEVVGDPVSLHVFASAFKRACVEASAYALIFILVLLLVTFRSLFFSALALLPLGVGALFTVGIMGVAGVDFNLANSIFMPLVVGAGVEYGVIILNRWREGRMLPGHLPYSTGKGVLLASLTTAVGFGTLMMSHHRGIFSLGFVAWEGSLCVVLSAMIVLPAVLAFVPQPRVAVDTEEVDEKVVAVFGADDPFVAVGDGRGGSGAGSGSHCRGVSDPE